MVLSQRFNLQCRDKRSSLSGVSRIEVLPAALASQIAAGEVVERPASAAKELIENAMDAGAQRCDVICDGGGVSRISVTDDGEGMSEQDARLSLERHATSKLHSIDDLSHLASYGFRGEALPSIASVCRFSLRTRRRDSEIGITLETEGGAELKVTPAGLPVGTTVEVRDLFYNVPARRKFLRSTGTESSHVTSTVEGAALTRPAMTFTLTRDERLVRELLRANTRAERVEQLFEQSHLVAIAGERGPLKVEAYLTRPELARPGAAGLWLIVNDRVVRDRMLATTIAQSFGSVLSSGHYPRGVVYVDLPSELIDVNVHPQKTEVRFVDPRATADAVYSIASRELGSALSLPPSPRNRFAARGENQPRPPVISMWGKRRPEDETTQAALSRQPSPDDDERPVEPKIGDNSIRPATSSGAESGNLETTSTDDSTAQAATSSGQSTGLIRDSAEVASNSTWLIRENTAQTTSGDVRWSSLRFIAQLRQTFLLCEGPVGIYVLDQHAAAERVAFQRLLDQYRSRTMAAQTLLFPVSVELPSEQVELVEQRSEEIAAVGLDVRVRGRQQVTVHAIPRLLQRASPERLLCDLVGEMARSGGRGFSAALEHALSLMACHGSLRAGDTISPTEAQALLGALDTVDFAGHCAHGRPVVAVMSYHELERKVGRR
jgi:DNA mismatch repair protein MutL